MVRLAEEEAPRRVLILVDASASMAAPPDKFDHARRIAAALAFLALSAGERVLFLPLASPPREGRANASPPAWRPAAEPGQPRTGRAAFGPALREAALWRAGGPTALAASVGRLAPRLGTGGLAFLVSDFLDPAGAGLALDRLASDRHRALAIHVHGPIEEAGPGPGPWLAVDSEGGGAIRLDGGQPFREAFRAFQAGVAMACLDRGVPLSDAPATKPFEDAVEPFLRAGLFAGR